MHSHWDLNIKFYTCITKYVLCTYVYMHACMSTHIYIYASMWLASYNQKQKIITSSLVYCLGKYVCRITTNCFTIASESIKDGMSLLPALNCCKLLGGSL